MPQRQPNILLVMADQLTAFALPCCGHPVVKAPHIGRLADEGVLFENAYCNSPLCAPSRYSMLTGRLPSRIGAYDNASEFPASALTIAHGLRAQGYRTILCGKMHFVGPDQLHGFEERLTTDIYPVDFGWTPNWDAPEERIDWWYHNMLSVRQAGIAEATNQLDFDDEVNFQAIRFLQDHARSADPRPFFLTVSFTHPHDPYAIRQAYWDRYRGDAIAPPRIGPLLPDRMDPHSQRLVRVSAMDEAAITEADVRRARHAYYGAISYVDDALGGLIGTLERFGLADDTLVVFTADHGDMLGERGLWYKMHFFEWAVRVPLIFWSPPRFAPRRSPDLASLLDLLPTLLDLGRPAGGDTADIEHEGASLAPLLQRGAQPDGFVLGEYLAEGALAPIFMIRRGAHKFIWSEPDPPLLFDLDHDPDELQNLAASPEHASVMASFESEVHERWDPGRLREEILKSQRARRFAFAALTAGRQSPWDFRPAHRIGHSAGGPLDLNDLERRRRFPPADG